jgi:hypothetical protein
MDKERKRILNFLKEIRETNFKKIEKTDKEEKVDTFIVEKQGEFIFSDTPFWEVKFSQIQKELDIDFISLSHHLLYLSEKELIKFTESTYPGEGKRLFITAKGIDALQPWWTRYKPTITNHIISGFVALIVSILINILFFK